MLQKSKASETIEQFLHQATRVVETLLEEIQWRGHGATIVILQDDLVDQANGFIDPEIRFAVAPPLAARVLACAKTAMEPTGILPLLGWKKLTYETIQRVAQLAVVDGALIMTNDLNVLQFGAKLTAREWHGKVKIGPNALGVSSGQMFDVWRRGTRHKSQ